MDITQISDIKELKSIAYDQMVILEQAQANLRLINQRIVEVQTEETEKIKAKKDK